MSRRSLVGNIYGDIKAIEYIGNRKYRCQCLKCGNISDQHSSNLKGEMICQKCGNGFRIDLAGEKYGHLTVKGYDKETAKWICECECGKTIAVKSNNLKSGNTTSCGKCARIEAVQKDIVNGTRVSQISKSTNRNNTSGTTGVGYNKRKNKWYAAIRFCGKRYWLGYYEGKEDAVRIRKIAEEELHNNFLEWYKTHSNDGE